MKIIQQRMSQLIRSSDQCVRRLRIESSCWDGNVFWSNKKMRSIVEVVSILLVAVLTAMLLSGARTVDKIIMVSAGALTLVILWAQSPLIELTLEYPLTFGHIDRRSINLVSIILCISLMILSIVHPASTRRLHAPNLILVLLQIIIVAILFVYREAINLEKQFLYNIPPLCRLSILFPAGILL